MNQDADNHSPNGFFSKFFPTNHNKQRGRPPKATTVRETWRRVWLELNALLGHMTLAAAIMVGMFVLGSVNHWMHSPDGLMLVDNPPYKLPLDWFMSAIDAGALSRLALASFNLFRHL